jgi:hypothetical protein
MATSRSGTSNQAQKLAAAASGPSLDMPAFGRDSTENVNVRTTGPTTRKRASNQEKAAVQPEIQPLNKAPRAIAAVPQTKLPAYDIAYFKQ